MTTHTLIVPNEPRHIVHDVALERAPSERVPALIRELARAHAKDALDVLATVMNDENVTASTRVLAAIAVLERGCGKATAAADDDQPAPRLETIRRIIVDPQHSEGCSDEPGLQTAPGTGPL